MKKTNYYKRSLKPVDVYIVKGYVNGENMVCGFTDMGKAQAYAFELEEKNADHIKILKDTIYE